MQPVDTLIIGTGPAGLHAAFQLGLQGFRSHLVEALPRVGGQCAELYADKKIYDIPALLHCTGAELIHHLQQQALPFQPVYHLGRLVTNIEKIPQKNSTGTPAHNFHVVLDNGTSLSARSIIIATGSGAYQPRKMNIKGLDDSTPDASHPAISYLLPTSSTDFTGLHLVICGDLDATLSTANQFAQQIAVNANKRPASVTLVYRRDKFRAEEITLALTQQLRAEGHLQFIAGQPIELIDNTLWVKESATQENTLVPVNALFILQGMVAQHQNYEAWGLSLKDKLIEVDPTTFQTNIPGFYAIGDVAHYPNKRKLIVSGFHEATLASYAISSYLQSGANIPQIYTSSNTHLQKILEG